MRVFFDTNVFVSAFASRGLCADLFVHVLSKHELIVGEVVLIELRRTFRNKIKLPLHTIDEIELLLRDSIIVPKPKTHLNLKITDSDDEWIVASAMKGYADILVTGDAALLKCASKAPLPIVNPREFWELLQKDTKSK